MRHRNWISICIAVIVLGIGAIAIKMRSELPVGKGVTWPAGIAVHAYTSRIYDREHCFMQRQENEKPILYFDVSTDIRTDYVTFVLYEYYDSLNNPEKPATQRIAPTRYDLKNGRVTISIDDGKPPHLGDGPYMAVISATPTTASKSSSGAGARSIYFYETWKDYPSDCWHY